MGIFSWLSGGPAARWKEASDTVNRWWDSIIGTQSMGEIIIREFGTLSIILCPSIAAMRTEYRVRHNEAMRPNAVGYWWSDGTRHEIYLPIKTTRAGNWIFNKLAMGDEMGHVLFGKSVDDVDKAEFYGQ